MNPETKEDKKRLNLGKLAMLFTIGIITVIVAVFFVLSIKEEQVVYTQVLESKLEEHGIIPAQSSCKHDRKAINCSFKNIVMDERRVKIGELKLVNVDGLKDLWQKDEVKNVDFRIEVLDIRNNEGHSLPYHALKEMVKDDGLVLREYQTQDELYAMIDSIESDITPFNLIFAGNASVNNGTASGDVFMQALLGGQSELKISLKDVVLPAFKNSIKNSELDEMMFSQVSLKGIFPNRTAASIDEQSKQEILSEFEGQANLISGLYGIDKGFMASIHNKLKDCLEKELLSFTLSLNNPNKDDLLTMFSSLESALKFGDMDVWERYKFTLD